MLEPKFACTNTSKEEILGPNRAPTTTTGIAVTDDGTNYPANALTEHHDYLHDINTSDLQNMIECKKNEMSQLKAEESALLARKKAFSNSNSKPVLIENQHTVFSNALKNEENVNTSQR